MTKIAEAILKGFVDFYDNAPLPKLCIRCASERVRMHCTVWRSPTIRRAGELVYLPGVPCRRVGCADCGLSWRQRPPGLFPHRHFQLCVIAYAAAAYLFGETTTLESVASECDCAVSTVKRWLNWIGAVASPADLQARLTELSGVPIVLPMVEAAERKARRARWDRMRQAALRRTAEVLLMLEALGAAAGFEPPGLRTVLERVVGDRSRYTTDAAPEIPEFANSGLQGRLGMIPM